MSLSDQIHEGGVHHYGYEYDDACKMNGTVILRSREGAKRRSDEEERLAHEASSSTPIRDQDGIRNMGRCLVLELAGEPCIIAEGKAALGKIGTSHLNR